MDNVSVLVPYRAGEPYRDAAWRWCRSRWEWVGVELIVESPGPGAEPADFNHPKAINAARGRASGEVLVVADADTFFDPPEWLDRAVAIVRAGDAAWALPSEYWQLSREQTRTLQALGFAPGFAEDRAADWVGYGNAYSGVVVVSAEAFDDVGGYDERIAWWGADDGCFATIMSTLHGEPMRVPGRALHQWHPRPDETHAHQGDQHALVRRYQAASGDSAAVRAVRFS